MRRTGRKKNEAAFTRWFCDMVKAMGAVTLTMVGGNVRQQNGLPDRYVCHPKFRGWLEFKKDDSKLSSTQRLLTQRLRDRGDVCLVVRYRADEIMELEDLEGNAMGWTDLSPLYCLGDRDCGLRLLEELEKARKLL